LGAMAGFIGTPSAAEQLITKVLPEERATAVVERLRRPAGPGPWEKLANLDDAVIAEYLGNEHPQTTALILSKLPPNRSATIVAALPRETAIAALSRLARLDDADRHAITSLEQVIAQNLIAPNSGPEKTDPTLRIASIFDAIDQRKADALLDLWTENEADTAKRVRTLMFTFEDFLQTSPMALQVLLRGVERDLLAVALKGASDGLKARFMDQMSARAARMLEDQMSARGPMRRKDVLAAQAKIVAMGRELEAAGELTLRPPAEGEAEEMVE